jgi:hypothetical protein
MLLENLQLAGAHAVEHCHQAGFYADATVFKLRMSRQHVEALVTVLLSQRYACAL